MDKNLIAILTGILCAGVSGVQLVRSYLGTEKRYAHTTDAKVVDLEKRVSSETRENGTPYTKVTYYPVFEYTIDGKTYRTRGPYGSNRTESFPVGSVQEVGYDPRKPEKIFTEQADNAGRTLLWAFFVSGLAIIILIASGFGQ